MSYEELMEENEKSKIKIKELEIQNENLLLEINALKKIVFGSKREHTPKEQIGEQCSLFDDPKKIEESLNEQIEENIEEITIHRKKKSKKKTSGIKKSALKDVIIEREEYTLNENEMCPECNSKLKNVGKKVVRQEIEFQPAKFKIKEYIKNIYKCEKCGTEESKKETSTFVEASVPNALLNHSFASPSLATEVIYQKYYLGVPLYRQEKMWEDKGLILPRSMMANWNIKIKEYYLENLWKLMLKTLKEENKLIHCDETTIQCNKEEGKKASSNSYMWQ